MSLASSPGTTPSADLNLLRTFLAVYRSGSLTAAAPSLGLSQPTVTAQIRALEQHTGRQLFVRLARGVQPTQFAHELAARVTAPLDALAAVDGDGPLSARVAPVHLAGPSELLCTKVLPALAGLVAQGVQLRVAQGLTEPLMEQMRAGQHDLVIATRRPRGRALAAIPLADAEYLLVIAPAWAASVDLDASGDDLAAALSNVPLVAYAEDLPIVRRYWRSAFNRTAPTDAALTVPNLHAVVAAVVAGAGYSVAPAALCEEHLAAGRLVQLNAAQETPLNTFFLAQRPGSETNPHVSLVKNTLAEAAKAW